VGGFFTFLCVMVVAYGTMDNRKQIIILEKKVYQLELAEPATTDSLNVAEKKLMPKTNTSLLSNRKLRGTVQP
jgi:hypothetical protein